jgi:PAS domain S-box-containing protein
MNSNDQDKILSDPTLLVRILNAIPTPVFIKDRDLRIAFVNDSACQAMGLKKDEIIGKSDADFFSAEQAASFTDRDRHVLETGEIDETEEVSGDGESAYLTRMSRVTGEDGEAFILGVNTDLREIHKRERALAANEARYRALAETAPVGIWQVTEKGRTLYVNPGLLALLRLDEAAFNAMDKRLFFAFDKDTTLSERLGAPGRFESDLVVEGQVRARALVVTSGWIIGDENAERSAMVTFVDITEFSHLQSINDEVTRLNLELSSSLRQLQQAQEESLQRAKLSQLGQLTATVAHELRNPLGAVRTSAYMLERRLKDADAALLTSLRRINNGVIRCDQIITQLLDFARSKNLQLAPVKLDDWLTSLVKEEAGMLPASVCVRLALGLDGENVMIDADRLSRVVINLLSNAAEAMMGKGDSRIDGKEEAPIIEVTTRRSERGIEIAVTDNGPGIPPDVLPRILDPLFTTKNFGTGLGLSAVRNILDQHRGGLEVATENGKGSCFTAWLPAEACASQAA